MASKPVLAPDIYRFGEDFELDVRAYELRSGGIPLKLKPIPMELLLFLVERRGEMVTREHIVERIWGKGVFLDTDNSINGAISKIRQVLRDDAAQPRFVQTVTGRGYRFIAPVTAGPSTPPAEIPAPAPPVASLIGRKVSHYRILEILGGGGMGVVYKAEDVKLGRRVAIKFLPAELANDQRAFSRLEREARAASALDHPNICSIYELEEYEDQPLIVMQLLEGRTLQEEIDAAAERKTTIPLDDVLEVAIQVADGLEAAHKKGIIHRDIKPANIFITSNGVVKILDFGLAKAVEGNDQDQTTDVIPSAERSEASRDPYNREDVGGIGVPRLALSQSLRRPPSRSLGMTEGDGVLAGASVTRTGLTMGTAGYMSPEQVRGEKLDARTDIFSFGLVLYQMVTGQRAFPGKTTAIVHDAILNNIPIPVRELNSSVPAKLVATIDKCLEKERSERFQSITEVSSILTDVIGRRKSRESYLYRYKWPVVALVVLVLGSFAVRYWVKHRPRHPSQADALVVSDFTNTTGDTVFDGTLKQAVSLQFEQTPSLHVMPDRQVIGTLNMMGHPVGERLSQETAREVCLRSNSRGLVSGSIAPMRDGYELRVTVTDCQTSDTLANVTARAKDRNEVLRVLGEAVNNVRGQLGESLASLQKFNKPLDEATTSSLEALQAYSQARYQEFHKGYGSAVPYYNLAVELDPGFALAYGALAQTHYNLRNRDLADKTMARAFELRNRTSRRERLRIEAQYYSFDTGDLNQALATLTEWAADFPLDYEPHRILNSLYRGIGRYKEALEESKRYLALAPDNSSAYIGLVMAYIRLNDADQALAAFQTARSRNLDNEGLRFVGCMALFLKGDMAGLEREVEAAKGNKNAEDWLLFQWASTQAYFGREQAAIATFQRAIKLAEAVGAPDRAGMWKTEIAMDEAEVGRPEPAQQVAKEALASGNSRDVQAKSALALALAGKTSQAIAIADPLKKQSPHNTLLQRYTVPVILAAVALEQKKWNQAVEVLKPTLDYEMGGDSICCLWPAYIRGKAYLEGKHAKEAANEFQKLIEHPGTVNAEITGSLVHLQLARAQAMLGDKVAARKSYQDFLTLWKDADPDIPIYKQAKAEYAKLK